MKKLSTLLVVLISIGISLPSFAEVKTQSVCSYLTPSDYLSSSGYWVITTPDLTFAAKDSFNHACYRTNPYPGAIMYADLNTGCTGDSLVACNGQLQPGWQIIGHTPCAVGVAGTIIKRTTNSPSCCTMKTWYRDNDGDGYGTSTTTTSCNRPANYSDKSGDCNDNNPNVHSQKSFFIDNDKDGLGGKNTALLCQTSPSTGYSLNSNDCDDSNPSIKGPLTYYQDNDRDQYGSNSSMTSCSRTAPPGYSSNNDDCNDSDRYSHPGAIWYRDNDGDGFGEASDKITTCQRPAGYVPNDEDIDDDDDEIGPEIREIDCTDYVEFPAQNARWTGGADSDGVFKQEFDYDEEEYFPAIEDACEWRCKLGPYNIPLYYVWNGQCIPFVAELKMSKVEWLTDRPGHDYKKINNKPSLTFADCQDACENENQKCVAWTYLAPGVQGTNPVCYLKNKWGQPRKMMKAFSGVTMVSPEYKTMESRTDRPGSDYYHFVSSGTAIACQNQCMIEDRCKSWTTVDRGDGSLTCLLKSSVPAAVYNKSCFSGVK